MVANGVLRDTPSFFFNDTATTEIYTLSLHDALPIYHDDPLGTLDHERVDARLPLVVDRKSTRLNSSHANISYAVFCLKKKRNGFAIGEDRLMLYMQQEASALANKPDAYIAPLGTGMNREAANFFFNDTATTEIYTLSLHDALPI